MLEITAINALYDNYIWLICDRQQRVAIVDPGETDPVVSAVSAANLTPSAILVTHSHHDHIGGVANLAERYHIPVYGPALEQVPGITHTLQGGELIQPGGMNAKLEVLSVPGHTIGHLAYYGHGALFCGDTLFTAGCGKVFTSTIEQLFLSLQKITRLPNETLVYCAHEYTEENLHFAHLVEPGNYAIQLRQERTRHLRSIEVPSVPSTLAEEKITNPFLRCNIASVIKSVEDATMQHLSSPEQVFQAMRHWKDHLG